MNRRSLGSVCESKGKTRVRTERIVLGTKQTYRWAEQLHRRNAPMHRYIEDGIEAIFGGDVQLKPSAAGHDEVQVIRPREVANCGVGDLRWLLGSHNVRHGG